MAQATQAQANLMRAYAAEDERLEREMAAMAGLSPRDLGW